MYKCDNHRQNLHRSDAKVERSVDFGGALYWLRYLRQGGAIFFFFFAFDAHLLIYYYLFFRKKKCPFDAITIINLPKNLEAETTHRYGANAFKLHRLPMPRPGQVLGLVGANGTGMCVLRDVFVGKIIQLLGTILL